MDTDECSKYLATGNTWAYLPFRMDAGFGVSRMLLRNPKLLLKTGGLEKGHSHSIPGQEC